MANLVGLEGQLDILLRKAEGLADFRDSRSHLQNSENEANMLALLW